MLAHKRNTCTPAPRRQTLLICVHGERMARIKAIDRTRFPQAHVDAKPSRVRRARHPCVPSFQEYWRAKCTGSVGLAGARSHSAESHTRSEERRVGKEW